MAEKKKDEVDRYLIVTESHMIYLGGDKFIEAPEAATVVRVNSFRDKFGKTLVELAKQDLVIENKKIYCGKMPVST